MRRIIQCVDVLVFGRFEWVIFIFYSRPLASASSLESLCDVDAFCFIAYKAQIGWSQCERCKSLDQLCAVTEVVVKEKWKF